MTVTAEDSRSGYVSGPFVSFVTPFESFVINLPVPHASGRGDYTAAAPNSSFRVMSNRSAFITLVQAAAKSRTNFWPASAEA